MQSYRVFDTERRIERLYWRLRIVLVLDLLASRRSKGRHVMVEQRSRWIMVHLIESRLQSEKLLMRSGSLQVALLNVRRRLSECRSRRTILRIEVLALRNLLGGKHIRVLLSSVLVRIGVIVARLPAVSELVRLSLVVASLPLDSDPVPQHLLMHLNLMTRTAYGIGIHSDYRSNTEF